MRYYLFRLGRFFTLWPVVTMNVRIHNLVLEVQPDAVVVAAVIAPAWHRPILSHSAAAGAMLYVSAITVLAVRDHVWISEISLNYSFVYVLLG